jgi:hypothetical protein
MTPRSPRESKAKSSPFTANIMEKWLDDKEDAVVLLATSFDSRHSPKDILKK